MDEGRITHSESYIFIAVSVFTGLPLTFICGMQRYSCCSPNQRITRDAGVINVFLVVFF